MDRYPPVNARIRAILMRIQQLFQMRIQIRFRIGFRIRASLIRVFVSPQSLSLTSFSASSCPGTRRPGSASIFPDLNISHNLNIQIREQFFKQSNSVLFPAALVHKPLCAQIRVILSSESDNHFLRIRTLSYGSEHLPDPTINFYGSKHYSTI